MVLPVSKGQARLVWNFQVWTLDGEHAFDFTVDAETGQVWTRVRLGGRRSVSRLPAAGRKPQPHHAGAAGRRPRRWSSNPANATASPFGWHDTNGVAGRRVHDDRRATTSTPTPTSMPTTRPMRAARPTAGPGLNFDFAIDLTQAPSPTGRLR